jgi:hypothetical protein
MAEPTPELAMTALAQALAGQVAALLKAEFARLGGPSPGSLMTKQQAASYLGLSVETLDNWRYTGVGPAYVKFPKAVMYRRGDLDTYVTVQTVQPLAAA